jgi:hypothetical protein
MAASPILMLTCKGGLSTTTAKPKPPAPSMLTKHKPRAPEAGLWPAREQLPDQMCRRSRGVELSWGTYRPRLTEEVSRASHW